MKYKLNIPAGYKRLPLPDKKKWTKALRSGKYKQAKEKLVDVDGSKCCLGVLCDLQGRLDKFVTHDWFIDSFDDVSIYEEEELSKDNPLYEYLNGAGDFPQDITVSMTNKTGKPVEKVCLAWCNDNGLTFKQIANIIDKIWYDKDLEQP